MNIHTHHFTGREQRLIHQMGGPPPGPGGAPTGPERIDATNAPRIIAETRTSLQSLQQEIQVIESNQPDEEARAATLQGIRTQLESLKLRITPVAAPVLPDAAQERERTELVTQTETMHRTLGERIQHLRELATNSVYQIFRSTGLGAPFRWIGSVFGGLGPIFKDVGKLLEPVGNAIAAPFRAMGPGAAGLFAGLVRKFNPSWADAMQRYAEGDRPFAEIDRAFRDAIATGSGPIAGRELEARSSTTAPAERQLRAIADRARGAGWDMTRFATETLSSVGGTGPITYVQLLTAAQRLPIASAPGSTPSAITERPAQTQNLALDTHTNATPISVVNGDTIIFASQNIDLNGAITFEGANIAVAEGATPGVGGAVVNTTDVSGTSWISLQRFAPAVPPPPNMAKGKLEIRITARPVTRPVIRTITVGGKTIRIQYP